MHGWLILDKPLGITSARAVDKVKRLLKPAKIGHAGTLDPLASGVLPLALGEATKTVSYIMDHRKSYRFRVMWGQERSTGDAEGEVTGTHPKHPERAEIEAVLPDFHGVILQTPPAYSAIKLGGKRAYALARAGEAVEMQAREVRVDDLKLIDCPPDSAEFTVECGKGTYVRSLAVDMARALGTLGYVSELRRLSVGKFSETHAISLEKLEEVVHKGGLANWLQPVESVLDDIPAWELDSTDAQSLAHGGMLALPPHEVDTRCASLLPREKADIWQALHQGRLVAMVTIADSVMKPVRVFNGWRQGISDKG